MYQNKMVLQELPVELVEYIFDKFIPVNEYSNFKLICKNCNVIDNVLDKSQWLEYCKNDNYQIPFYISMENLDVDEVLDGFAIATPLKQSLIIQYSIQTKNQLAYFILSRFKHYKSIDEYFETRKTMTENVYTDIDTSRKLTDNFTYITPWMWEILDHSGYIYKVFQEVYDNLENLSDYEIYKLFVFLTHINSERGYDSEESKVVRKWIKMFLKKMENVKTEIYSLLYTDCYYEIHHKQHLTDLEILNEIQNIDNENTNLNYVLTNLKELTKPFDSGVIYSHNFFQLMLEQIGWYKMVWMMEF